MAMMKNGSMVPSMVSIAFFLFFGIVCTAQPPDSPLLPVARDWTLADDDASHPIDDSSPVTFTVHLVRDDSSIQKLRNIVDDVSDPSSPRYGSYLSRKQVASMLAPTPTAYESALSWLEYAGISRGHCPDGLRTPRGWKTLSSFYCTSATGDAIRIHTDASTLTKRLFYAGGDGAEDEPSLSRYVRRHSGASSIRVPHAVTPRMMRDAGRHAPFIATISGLHPHDLPPLPRGLHHKLHRPHHRIHHRIHHQAKVDGDAGGIGAPAPMIYAGVYSQAAGVAASVNASCSLVLRAKQVRQHDQAVLVDQTYVVEHYVPPAPVLHTFTGLVNQVEVTFTAQANYSGTMSDPATTKGIPGQLVSPALVHRYYAIEPNRLQVTKALGSQAVAEFDAQYFSQASLDAFLHSIGYDPINVSVIGPNNQSSSGTEATLDIQWILGIAPHIPTTFWSVGDEGFLVDWAKEVAEAEDPPLVHSISYGAPESDMPLDYIMRADQELMGLAARGLSIISTSGDIGASDGDSCDPLHADYPSSSAYTTSAGATRLVSAASETPLCTGGAIGATPLVCEGGAEQPCSTAGGDGFTTGGMFSSIFPVAPWQSQVVHQYLNNSAVRAQLPPASYWVDVLPNSTLHGLGRAYNDLAAFGSIIPIYQDGGFAITGGTSASGPMIAAMLSILNEARLHHKLPPLGLANPLLYKIAAENPNAFNGILPGNNKCAEGDVGSTCCAYGMPSVGERTTWNPLSGLGSPNVQVLLQEVMKPFQ